MKKQVTITIAGTTGSGKSTFTYLIKNMLKENGFEVDFKDDDFKDETSFDECVSQHINERVEALQMSTKVVIKEQHLRRGWKEQFEKAKAEEDAECSEGFHKFCEAEGRLLNDLYCDDFHQIFDIEELKSLGEFITLKSSKQSEERKLRNVELGEKYKAENLKNDKK